MIADWRLAEALAIQRAHSARARVFVAERIGALALAGDAEGVKRLVAIAAKRDGLMRATRQ